MRGDPEEQALGQRILEFMGSDILREVRRAPQWRKNLDTNQETPGCRHDRRMASARQKAKERSPPAGWISLL